MKVKYLYSLIIFLSLNALANEDQEKLKDLKRCEEHKEILERYRKEGVMGYNPATKEVVKMPDKQAEEVIKNKEFDVQLFCS